MRFAVDTGGTFTDLIVEDGSGRIRMFKSATTPADPIQGVLDALSLAAVDSGESLADFMGRGTMFIHGTTHAINSIITGNTAKTALLVTEGHRDILVIREAGRLKPFDNLRRFPSPYIPRALTFGVPGRILSDGSVYTPLSEASVLEVIDTLKAEKVEAVAVCLLWSVINPEHELRVGELLKQKLPRIPFTLSHQLNPSIREYRRASSTAIDASLKPLMQRYLGSLEKRLREAGFGGRVLVLTSQGGMMDAAELAEQPIHAINSGPSMAPLAGRHFARNFIDPSKGIQGAIVADTGGTTYDVSLVLRDSIPMTRDMWIGEPFLGHMTGFPSVDVKSVGAGGGSIARVDHGGLLHVGPKSAGAVPGPACYGRGGEEPTLTDACVVLNWIDASYFLGGAIKLDPQKSRVAVESRVAKPLGMSVEEAAAAIIDVATENMVQAISDITINQGVDPTEAILVGGGGAAGLNSLFIARRLGCPILIIPDVGPALSATGALMSDLSADYQQTRFMTTSRFEKESVNKTLDGLLQKAREFINGPGRGAQESRIEYFVEARYENQVWEIEVPLPVERFVSDADIGALKEAFHRKHQQIFSFRDEASDTELVTWTIRVRCKFREQEIGGLGSSSKSRSLEERRTAYFSGHGHVETRVISYDRLGLDREYIGPLIVESPFTTVVIDPEASCYLDAEGTIVVHPSAKSSSTSTPEVSENA